MPPTRAEVRELITHGETQTIAATIQRVTPIPEKAVYGGGWVLHRPLFFLLDAHDVALRRGPDHLHIARGNQDIIRGNGHYYWVFENGGEPYDPPLRVDRSRFVCLGTVAWLLQKRSLATSLPVGLRAAGKIYEGEIAGRPTWSLRDKSTRVKDDLSELRSLDIDQELGIILAVETGYERLEFTKISFPTSLPASDWTGPWEPFDGETPPSDEEPDIPEIPGRLSVLPSQSDDPRRLRVFVSEISLDGSAPAFQVGQSIRLTLKLNSAPEPIAGLSTTRRGHMQQPKHQQPHLDPTGTFLWPTTLRGDGWVAEYWSPIPVQIETEVEGWFENSIYGPVEELTDLKIERIFARVGPYDSSHRIWKEVQDTTPACENEGWRVRDVVLDTTLDNVDLPPLRPPALTAHDATLANDYLWLCDVRYPVVRCWNISSGNYLGETLVPVVLLEPYRGLQLVVDTQSKVIATNREAGWALVPGQRIAQRIPDWKPDTARTAFPTVAAPWRIISDLGCGLYGADTTDSSSSRVALIRKGAAGTTDVTELDPSGSPVQSAVQIGERYIARTWMHEYHLDSDFQVVETHSINPLEEGWVGKGPIAYLTNNDNCRFVERTSGEEYPALPIPDGHQALFLDTTTEKITVLIRKTHPRDPRTILPTGIAIYDYQRWTTGPLQKAPDALFQ